MRGAINTNLTDFPVAGWSSPVARQAHNMTVKGNRRTRGLNKKGFCTWPNF